MLVKVEFGLGTQRFHIHVGKLPKQYSTCYWRPLFFTLQTNAPNESHCIWFSSVDEGGGCGRGGAASAFISTWLACVVAESVSALMLMSVLPRSEHDDDDDDVRVSSTAATVCRLIQHYCSISSFLSTSSSRQTLAVGLR